MGKLYWLIFLALAGAAPGGLWLASNQYRRLGRVHILTVMVFAAYGLQTTSVALELMHLGVYSKDGKGLQWRHTFFAADFAAETMQGASELITSLTLLFLACGWTTVTVGSVTSRLVGSLESGVGGANAATAAAAAAGGAAGLKALSGKRGGGAELGKKLRKDVPEVAAAVVKGIFTDGDGPEVKRRVGAVAGALREPARLVGVTGRAPGRSWRQSLDASSFAMFLFVFIHMYLEIASRRFTDDFSAFHDHAHWPGYCLVLLRLCVAAVFYVGGRSASRLAESQDRSTAKFLKRLDVVGLTWLLAFPFLVCTAWILTPMTRHRYVVGGVALLQCASSLGLGWLVLASEKFLSLSTVAPRSSSAANVLGARGFAAKLAVD